MELTSKPPETETPVPSRPRPRPRLSPPPPPSFKPKPSSPLSFTNGTLKRHPFNPTRTLYKECLKNHAASLGGHAIDGCGEFMPSPQSSPSDPTSLKCAACGCHRNFHRRDDDDDDEIDEEYHHNHIPVEIKRRNSNSTSAPPSPLASSYFPSAPQMLLALSTGGLSVPDNTTTASANPSTRKRFRTKFSREQKEKMFLFSEKLGWKMQKQDEGLVEEFCNEVGVSKVVLKVWMHNNKHTSMKRDGLMTNTTTTNNRINDGNLNNNIESNNHNTNAHIMNGSSSSS